MIKTHAISQSLARMGSDPDDPAGGRAGDSAIGMGQGVGRDPVHDAHRPRAWRRFQ